MFNRKLLMVSLILIAIVGLSAVSASDIDDETIALSDDASDSISVDEASSDLEISDESQELRESEVFIDDNNYASDFKEDGTMIEGAITSEDIVIGNLTNKNMIISGKYNLHPLYDDDYDADVSIINGTLTLTADASGSVVEDLTFIMDNVPASSYPGLAVISIEAGASDIYIGYNTIDWTVSGSDAYTTAMGIMIVGGSDGITRNITVSDNDIYIYGDAPYIYAVDIFSDPYTFEDYAVVDVFIEDNDIYLYPFHYYFYY